MVSFCKKAELEADESPLEQELQSLRKTMEHGFALQLSILQDLRHQMTAPRVKRLARPSMESTARLSVESESVPSPSSPSPSSPSMSSLIDGDARSSIFSRNVSVNNSLFRLDSRTSAVSQHGPVEEEEEYTEDESEEVEEKRQKAEETVKESPSLKRAKNKKKRDSSRHSFVRRALEAHQERATSEAVRLARLREKKSSKTGGRSAWRIKLDKVISSTTASNVIMMVIMLNVILLGVEVDVSTDLGQDDIPKWFGWVNSVIVLFFVFEVILKCVAQGLEEYWCGPEASWNIMDAIIIAVSLVETGIDIWAQTAASNKCGRIHISSLVQMMSADSGSVTNSSQLRLVRSIRLARALRGVRVVRLFRYVSALRTLALCIVSTVGSLIWTLVLLVLLWYTFGVLQTQLVSDHCRDAAIEITGNPNAKPLCPSDYRHWRTVSDSMLTLFMSITGGLSWEDALSPLRNASPVAVIFMVVYIVMTVFAVLNVVTGVFCNTAIESANADKDIAVIKQLQKHSSHVEALRKIFEEIDADSLDVVSIHDLEEAMQQQKLSSFLESMGISTEDVWTLFMIMDHDQTGLVNLEEFVSGCLQGRGPAKSIQLVKMSYENKVTRQALKKVGMEIRRLTVDLSDLRRRNGMPESILPRTANNS